MEKKKRHVVFIVKDGKDKTKKIVEELRDFDSFHIIAKNLAKKQLIYLKGAYYNISLILKIYEEWN